MKREQIVKEHTDDVLKAIDQARQSLWRLPPYLNTRELVFKHREMHNKLIEVSNFMRELQVQEY